MGFKLMKTISLNNSGMNNRILLAWHNELESLKSSVLYILLKGRINEFYKENGIRISTLFEKIKKLQDEYFVIEGGEVKSEGEGSDRKPVCVEGKSLEDFTKEMEALLNSPIQVIF